MGNLDLCSPIYRHTYIYHKVNRVIRGIISKIIMIRLLMEEREREREIINTVVIRAIIRYTAPVWCRPHSSSPKLLVSLNDYRTLGLWKKD